MKSPMKQDDRICKSIHQISILLSRKIPAKLQRYQVNEKIHRVVQPIHVKWPSKVFIIDFNLE